MRREITDKPSLRTKQDVRMLHNVWCYRDRAEDIDTYDTWGGTCICHNAVWHSCPDSGAGKRIFDSLPQEAEVHDSVQNEILAELKKINATLERMGMAE